jgi:hypothetical protein
MKLIKRGANMTVKVMLPKDLPWKVFGSLINDLEMNSVPNLPTRYSEMLPEVLGCIRNRDVSKLMDLISDLGPQCILKENLSNKSDALAFFCLYQVGSFLKKYPFPGQNTKEKALIKFDEADDICRAYNSENYKALLSLNERHPDFLGVVEEMQDDILSLLGETPNVDSIISHAAHGPGVSLGDLYKGGKVTDFYKWSSLPYTVTQATLPLAKTAILADPRWIGALDHWYRKSKAIPVGRPICMESFWDSVFRVVEGSRTTTVPKTAVIDRTIAIEPLLNVFLQLGVDRVIRRRLKRIWGYDLDTQERNQILALEGSIHGLLTTVDLSMASDLISLMICMILLPAAWFDLLWDLRSPVTRVDGYPLTLEKISSMGNGFTFALESLIFGALVRCSIRRTKSARISAVFGDDIVLPKTAYPYLQELLNLCGFKLNTEKSYSSGPFRESCGRDYFLGYNVRPTFLTKKIQSVKDLFYLHNSLILLEESLDWTWGVDLSATKELVKSWIPKKFRDQFFGPITESVDTHLFSSKRLRRNRYGQQVYWQIQARPRKYKTGYGDFFFRKLMVSLKSVDRKLNAWDRKHRFDTGNAFDVTRREKVQFVCARVCGPQWTALRLTKLA